jgi:hypothetical protein
MKFFGKKSLSSLLFWVSTICTLGFAILLVFILFSLILNNNTIHIENELNIALPFTQSFIKSEYSPIILFSIVLFLLFYGVFFYLLRTLFMAFSKEKVIFTNKMRGSIRKFGFLNIFLPPFGIITTFFIKKGVDFEIVLQGGLLVLLGVFSLFVVAVFKEGIVLQEENDLTI